MKRTQILSLSLCLSTLAWGAPEAVAQDAGPATAVRTSEGDAGTEAVGDEDVPSRPALRVDRMPFSQESIREVVAYHQEEIQACYEKTLADKNRVIDGKLMTGFVITKDGEVKDAKVLKRGTTLREPRLHECVIATLTVMKFPKPHDRREHPVEYPFNLKTVR